MTEPTDIDIRDFDVAPDHFSLRERDAVRGRLAGGVFLLIAVITLLLVGGVLLGRLSMADASALRENFLSPIIAIFIGIISFFFGAERRSR